MRFIDPKAMNEKIRTIAQNLVHGTSSGCGLLVVNQYENVVGAFVTTDEVPFDALGVVDTLRAYADAIEQAHQEGLSGIAVGERAHALMYPLQQPSILHVDYHEPLKKKL